MLHNPFRNGEWKTGEPMTWVAQGGPKKNWRWRGVIPKTTWVVKKDPLFLAVALRVAVSLGVQPPI